MLPVAPLGPLARPGVRPALCMLMLLGAGGCADASDDTSGGELPPEETGEEDSETGFDTFGYDTVGGDTGTDGTPKHLLTITHEGRWEMSPNGGPWDAMTGELTLTEVVDGNLDKPWCEVRYALTGQASEDNCPQCDATFEVLYYVAEGDETLCLDPETPANGATLRLGWSENTEQIWMDYQGSGVWMPWYDGRRVDDIVYFEWETEVGVAVPDEDDG